jgi:hypothetical protein
MISDPYNAKGIPPHLDPLSSSRHVAKVVKGISEFRMMLTIVPVEHTRL